MRDCPCGCVLLLLALSASGCGSGSDEGEPKPNPGPSPVQQGDDNRITLQEFIIGKWDHQFGPWKLEFQSDGRMRLWPPLGDPVAGTYQIDVTGALAMETAGGGKIQAIASVNGDGNLLLQEQSSNVRLFGSDGKAVFVRSRR